MSIREGSNDGDDTLRPQVIATATKDTRVGVEEPLSPLIISTAHTGRIAQAAPFEPQQANPVFRKRRYSLAIRLGFAGLAAAFCGWLCVDLYLWIGSAFNFSAGLGWAATAAVAVGIAAAVGIIVHEVRSYMALKNAEANQQRFSEQVESKKSSEIRIAIRDVIAEIPRDRESTSAIETFQRKVQSHHSATQQIELLSQTVVTLLDRRAEAIVRQASARAFGITAMSPTAITDIIFFLACSVRMVREIAACYGHRPTALATAHLLKRLVFEAGKLGAVDLAGMTLSQHISGAVVERVATSAAESMYAAQRMARLGLVTMGLCRPIPFSGDEIPGILSTLIGKLFARAAAPSEQMP